MKNTVVTSTLIAVFTVLGIHSIATAAVITTDGSVQNQPNWDTAGFGDYGYAIFLGTQTAQTGGGVATSGQPITLGFSVTFGNTGTTNDVQLENPQGGTINPGAIYDIGLSTDNLLTVATLNFSSLAPKHVRIGVLVGATDIIDPQNNDRPNFPDDVGINGVGQEVDQHGLVPAFVQADWYFFDVSDIADGETINIQASRISATPGELFNPIVGVAITVIPEPGTLVLVLAGLALIGSRRRRMP